MLDGSDEMMLTEPLSDSHAYEPNLEFDDSDLLNEQHSETEEGIFKN